MSTEIIFMTSSGSTSKDDYITQCKLCGYGIFKKHKWIWLREPIGMSHAECKERKENGRR